MLLEDQVQTGYGASGVASGMPLASLHFGKMLVNRQIVTAEVIALRKRLRVTSMRFIYGSKVLNRGQQKWIQTSYRSRFYLCF